MAGIYIHIPFCRKACHYCNFHFSTSLGMVDRMVDAIVKEVGISEGSTAETIQTIYFGGGTPSLIAPNLIKKILEKIYLAYNVSPDAEITLEANPDDITITNAEAWKAMGINRFSIGIQSFFEDDLKWMNRAHDAAQSRKCIEIIRQVGFDNFSIDLIYGTPGQSIERWVENLDIAFSYQVPHLSCYALTVEEGTALHHMIETRKKEQVDADEQSPRFERLVEKTKEAGYRHYEISNFAIPGKESKHNRSYWEGSLYQGFGPAAHSFDGKSRRWNVSNNMEYILSIENNKLPFEIELLSEVDQLNEYIMTSLRCDTGINKEFLVKQWGEEKMVQINKEIAISILAGKIEEDEKYIRLSAAGKFFADGIASSLFFLQ
jgi:oxygen-independent coproporphyrinogen-3 oxidase